MDPPDTKDMPEPLGRKEPPDPKDPPDPLGRKDPKDPKDMPDLRDSMVLRD